MVVGGLVIILAVASGYGSALCPDPAFQCVKVHSQHTSWERLWPDSTEREIVQKINRTNQPLRGGMVIAVPKKFSKEELDFAPFSPWGKKRGRKYFVWDPNKRAWAAYNAQGQLVRWGPGSDGRSFCPDIKSPCQTPSGLFHVLQLSGAEYRSHDYLTRTGEGAPLPYFMKFHPAGFGIHGCNTLLPRPTSHGCIRILTADAEWLAKHFMRRGTRVIVLPYA